MKQLQEKIKKFITDNKMEAPVEYRVLDTVSELGEVAKEILIMSDYGKQPIKYREEFKSELGDVVFSLVAVANALDIDLEQAVDEALSKYEKRLAKGSAGSENE